MIALCGNAACQVFYPLNSRIHVTSTTLFIKAFNHSSLFQKEPDVTCPFHGENELGHFPPLTVINPTLRNFYAMTASSRKFLGAFVISLAIRCYPPPLSIRLNIAPRVISDTGFFEFHT